MTTEKIDPEIINNSETALVPNKKDNYKLKIFNGCMNLMAHVLIGATVGVSILFSFTYDFDYYGTKVHIILCVLGYQLLMAEAILTLSPHNSWTTSLKYVHKRIAHWVLQIMGSTLAIVGSFIKMMDKTVHFDTLHAQFSLVALLFTTACLVNGLTSLYAYELRKIIPGTLSKVTHICFGTIAFSASAVCLCYGFDKPSFNRWATPPLKAVFMAFVGIFTVIIIVNPIINFVDKSFRSLKR
ncbi:uncharacterized protein LOC128674276 [Plodia interpunctella]|uniref:uncharacterized protein LOC128674276 n=1 Tax=Plodia interpunctella TaxID=58824 RepID=UPI0023686CF5|nr:uncharacterized protein LOC128674276 [Plodia interpunctella]